MGRLKTLANRVKTQPDRHPLCVYCEREGRVSAGCIVDHIIPHRGDMVLFWDRSNWQSLCKPCHDIVKKREEARILRS